MPIATARLFSPDPSDARELLDLSAESVFNEHIVPLANSFEPEIDLDGENARASERRGTQAQIDDFEFDRRRESEDALLDERSAGREEERRMFTQGEDGIPPERSQEPAGGFSRNPPSVTSGRFSSLSQRNAVASGGGAAILLDSNAADGVRVISPRIVIPDNATKKQREAATKYVNEIARIQKEKFGRKLKPQVLTRSQNGRGRANAFHTEGFAVTDDEFVGYIQSPEGRQRYQRVLRDTLGSLNGAKFFLPHSKKDPGAVNKKLGVSEVSLAQDLIKDL